MDITRKTRFLMTREIPTVGESCKGRETFTNGQSEVVKTPVVKEIRQILSGKYFMKTEDDSSYLVDIIPMC